MSRAPGGVAPASCLLAHGVVFVSSSLIPTLPLLDARLLSLSLPVAVLHALGVHIPTAKAIRLFKAVDRNNSGDIDRGEFEMALYAVNPRSGSRSFRPHDLLTPGDAFDM